MGILDASPVDIGGGLLGQSMSPQGLLGIQLLAAASPRERRTGFGEGLLGALQGVRAMQQQEEDRRQRAAAQAMQMRLQQSQIGENESQAAQRNAALEQQQRVREVLRGAFSPVTGTEANAASGITGPRPEALGAVGQPKAVNYQALLAAGVPPDLVKTLAESRNFGRDKVARVEETTDPTGRPVRRQFTDFGDQVGGDLPQWKSPMSINTGGTEDLVDPVTQRVLARFQKTMTPDGTASNAVQMANLALSRQRLAMDQQNQNKPQYDAERGVLVDARGGTARPVLGADGQPLGAKPDAALRKEMMSIGQQRSLIDGALKSVQETPSAFSFQRGVATMAGALPESAAGRLDTDAERQARAFIFNNVSAVINERAGAAQSAQELARLRGFLPAETDNAQQITSKLRAFQTYLDAKEAGTTGKASPVTSPAPSPGGGMPSLSAIDAELRRRGNTGGAGGTF